MLAAVAAEVNQLRVVSSENLNDRCSRNATIGDRVRQNAIAGFSNEFHSGLLCPPRAVHQMILSRHTIADS
jgi:hypothetical protein